MQSFESKQYKSSSDSSKNRDPRPTLNMDLEFEEMRNASREEYEASVKKIRIKEMKNEEAEDPLDMVRIMKEREILIREIMDRPDGVIEIHDEEKTEEIAIIEELPSDIKDHSFYLGRRNKEGKVFDLETVIIARKNNDVFVTKYLEEDGAGLDRLDEVKYLDNRAVQYLNNQVSERESDSGNINLTDDEIARGGEGSVRKAMHREEEKLFPQEAVYKIYERHITPEQIDKVIRLEKIIKHFIDESSDANGKYILKQLGVLELGKDPQGRMVRTGLSELATIQPEQLENKVISNLNQIIEDERVKTVTRLKIANQIFRALRFLNQHGIIYTDSKPENILLTDHQIKLTDFGMSIFNRGRMKINVKKKYSKLEADELPQLICPTPRVSGKIIGTVGYLNPVIMEKWHAASQIKPSQDVFGACSVIFELLTRRDIEDVYKGVYLDKHSKDDENPNKKYFVRYSQDHHDKFIQFLDEFISELGDEINDEFERIEGKLADLNGDIKLHQSFLNHPEKYQNEVEDLEELAELIASVKEIVEQLEDEITKYEEQRLELSGLNTNIFEFVSLLKKGLAGTNNPPKWDEFIEAIGKMNLSEDLKLNEILN